MRDVYGGGLYRVIADRIAVMQNAAMVRAALCRGTACRAPTVDCPRGLWLGVAVLLAAAAVHAAPPTRLFFSHGSSSAFASGEVVGEAAKDYVLAVNADQTMTVTLSTDNAYLYFNVTPANSKDALYVGQIAGEPKWSGKLPAEGEYIISVYFAPAEARQDHKAKFKLTVTLS